MKTTLAGCIAVGLLTISFSSCEQAVTTGSGQGTSVSGDWLIPKDQIHDGGPGKDGIPALTDPAFVSADAANFLSDNDLVLGVLIGNVVRAYPHPILDWHEIINDSPGGMNLSITYCPLTGSGIAWDRNQSGGPTTFGVSGLLYNSNLIAYDRGTNSNWSQMRLQCVNGPLQGTEAQTYRVIETNWKTWKQLYAQSEVVSVNTGYSRPYGNYPYGDYKTSPFLIFPAANDDGRLGRKDRVHGVIIGDRTKVYPLASFGDTTSVINDVFNGTPLIAVGNTQKNFAAMYQRRLTDGTELSFVPLQDEFPAVMADNEGTKWDVFGRGLSGPRAGQSLEHPRAYTAYWFAWAAFFPNAEIHR
jgi:hypothetical protein